MVIFDVSIRNAQGGLHQHAHHPAPVSSQTAVPEYGTFRTGEQLLKELPVSRNGRIIEQQMWIRLRQKIEASILIEAQESPLDLL